MLVIRRKSLATDTVMEETRHWTETALDIETLVAARMVLSAEAVVLGLLNVAGSMGWLVSVVVLDGGVVVVVVITMLV